MGLAVLDAGVADGGAVQLRGDCRAAEAEASGGDQKRKAQWVAWRERVYSRRVSISGKVLVLRRLFRLGERLRSRSTIDRHEPQRNRDNGEGEHSHDFGSLMHHIVWHFRHRMTAYLHIASVTSISAP